MVKMETRDPVESYSGSEFRADVRYRINQYAAVRHGGRNGRKADLNWKLKISNMADNADITQSKARDTWHRQMQEVNSWCTDSGHLRAEYCIVAFHTIQSSSVELFLLA